MGKSLLPFVPDGVPFLAVDEHVSSVSFHQVYPRTAVDDSLGRRNVVHVELVATVSAGERIQAESPLVDQEIVAGPAGYGVGA